MNEDLAYSIGLNFGLESTYLHYKTVDFRNIVTDIRGYERDFWRGIFRTYGQLFFNNAIHIDVPIGLLFSEELLNAIPAPYTLSGEMRPILNFYGSNAIDFLGWIIYEPMHVPQAIPSVGQDHFRRLLFGDINQELYLDMTIRFKRHSPEAVIPAKAHPSDSGYDLTLIKVDKTIALPVGDGLVTMYDTGISVEPPTGYYFDAVPRSSLFKTGYILANSVGIIDRSYRGTIKAALMKLDTRMPDLELPARVLQLVPRRIEYMFTKEVEELTSTTRESGGFGSTNA